jgi:uncharacterized protein YfaT (DUF1175 family)
MTRRQLLFALLAACLYRPAAALSGLDTPAPARLDGEQSRRFRAWMLSIIAGQLEAGPSPRWPHRDCAGLVRFAVRETLRRHDAAWRRANGMHSRRLPPELDLNPAQRSQLQDWSNFDGRRLAYVSALALVQKNSVFLGKELARAEPGDLLFFDQGDEQHLMVWMGSHIAYHTGTETPSDNGLRAVPPRRLMQWEDTRWRPQADNSNYIGVFRLAFLSA